MNNIELIRHKLDNNLMGKPSESSSSIFRLMLDEIEDYTQIEVANKYRGAIIRIVENEDLRYFRPYDELNENITAMSEILCFYLMLMYPNQEKNYLDYAENMGYGKIMDLVLDSNPREEYLF